MKLQRFIDFVREVEYTPSIFGRLICGMPSKLKIAPIWKPICEGTLTASLRANMISFYKTHALDVEVLAEYNRLLTKNGDNHTSASKIIAVHAYINTFA